MILINKWILVGPTNGSIGAVRDSEYDVSDPAYMPLNLPRLVWVEFEPGNYKGPSFFPDDVTRSNWVIIPCTGANIKEGKVSSSRTMLPLKLCWSLTPWKVQGSTVRGKLLANLGLNEPSSGLAYVVFSRVRRFKDIAIEGGLCWDRLTNKINLKTDFKER